MPPLPADFIHARACKLKCEKILTRPNWQPGRQKIFLFTLNTTALPVLPKMGAKKHHGFQKICGVAAWSIFNLYQQKTVIYI